LWGEPKGSIHSPREASPSARSPRGPNRSAYTGPTACDTVSCTLRIRPRSSASPTTVETNDFVTLNV